MTDIIDCNYETEGFCLFDGACLEKHELLTGETVCNEYCRQYIKNYLKSQVGLDNLTEDDRMLMIAVDNCGRQ